MTNTNSSATGNQTATTAGNVAAVTVKFSYSSPSLNPSPVPDTNTTEEPEKPEEQQRALNSLLSYTEHLICSIKIYAYIYN